ncbi:tetratricopeptide repeat protein [Nostoc sp. ChiQUE01b]|uniref:tetratricopeptide repeat protein n=1 Tax=Nostoc sp. ChiQUE01b TaxID=3075376 RepID=UPI002AD37449|nr:tetratricopeptide repeat protein [Nostoc sp. ChiQUE01b]MDZ8257242.1 tetratricopeptide repeat protein [Nostoc sp. ChiQUE01b]
MSLTLNIGHYTAKIMALELTDWDRDLPSQGDEEYQALVRTLNFTEGFGLLFVRCSPAEGEQLITKVKENIPNKNIEVLRLEQAVTNLYEIIDNLDKKKGINILFITGLEHSFYKYEECKSLTGWNSRDIYSYSWKGVPPVLINLNQQRERFKDNFNICFVFLLPIFAIKYFIQRAPDFFDWRSGLFEFPIDSETLEQESSRIIQDGDYEKYLALTPEERTQEILRIQELIAEDHQIPTRQYNLLINLGKLQSAGQDYKEAIASYDKALEFKPDYHQAWYNRGIALRNLRRNEEAIASYDKALEIEPDNYQAWVSRGIALENLGRNEEAIASFTEALKVKTDYHDAWNWHGYVLDKLGRYEEAIASYDQALKINSDDDYAWTSRGISLKELGRYEEAIASYDQALKINSDDDYAWTSRGISLEKLGRYEEALISLDKALELEPKNDLSDLYYVWKFRGITLNKLGRYEEALISLDKALELEPKNDLSDLYYVWNWRGITLNELDRYEEALISLDKALELEPKDDLSDLFYVWRRRGITLNKLGRYEEAIASYDQALSIKPDDHEAWYNRGKALLNLGRNEEAIASYDKAQQIQPDFTLDRLK